MSTLELVVGVLFLGFLLWVQAACDAAASSAWLESSLSKLATKAQGDRGTPA